MKNLNIGWVLSGDSSIPGARIHGENIHKYLLVSGTQSHILRQPCGLSDSLSEYEVSNIMDDCLNLNINILIFQKVHGERASSLCRRLSEKRIKCVFIACDFVDNELASCCACVFAVSSFLKGLFSRHLQYKIHVLDDAIEVPEINYTRERSLYSGDRIKGVYLTSSFPCKNTLRMLSLCAEYFDVTVISAPPKANILHNKPNLVRRSLIYKLTEMVKEHKLSLPSRMLWKLVYGIRSKRIIKGFPETINPKINFVEWKLETVYDILAEHDIGLIPVCLDSTFKMAKSSNRLTTLLALGLSVIASPVPSYVDCANDGKHALFASTAKDWIYCINKIINNQEFAKELARNGKELAWNNYSQKNICKQFLNIISSI